MAKKDIAIRGKDAAPKRTVGIVSVVTGKDLAKLTLLDENKVFKSTGTDAIKIKLKDLPKYPKLKAENKTPVELRVRMGENDETVEAFGPVRGMHTAKLVDMGKRENKDADPMPYEKTFGAGTPKENSHLEFFAVYKITQGAFKNCEAAYYLHYKFEEDSEEEGVTQFSFNPSNPKATRGQQLIDWGMAHGNIWSDPIPWDDDTILPELLERILDNDLEVNLVFDKGYIQSVQPLDSVGLEGDEEDAEEEAESVDEDEDEPEFMKEPAKKPVRKPRRASKSDDDDDL